MKKKIVKRKDSADAEAKKKERRRARESRQARIERVLTKTLERWTDAYARIPDALERIAEALEKQHDRG